MAERAEQLARAVGRAPHPDDWAPHAGPQERFLRLSCFEAFYGGAAGGGKSDALLISAARGVGRGWGAGYSGILFRRTFPDLERSLIRRSLVLYPRLGGQFNAGKFIWRFPGGESIAFAHMLHETDALAHKSAQYQFVGFDELTSFTEFQYTYLFSRLRSAAGVPCRIRSASNPGDVGHPWVRRRWFDWVSRRSQRPAAAGEIRYYVRRGDDDVEVPKGTPLALGRTFVPATLADNPTLVANDPGYRARLAALPVLERLRLEGGDWDAEPAKKDFYDGARAEVLRHRPPNDQVRARVRAWDFGATADGDPSAGVLMAMTEAGRPVVEHCEHFAAGPDEVFRRFEATARADVARDARTVQVIPEDPGAAGKMVVAEFQRRFPDLAIYARRPTGDKQLRFQPFASRQLAGNTSIVDDGSWDVQGYHAECEAFPLGAHDDRVDATSDAYAVLAGAAPADVDGWLDAFGAGVPRREYAVTSPLDHPDDDSDDGLFG
jgi:predicted phage terminase large subunit-like protein